MKLYFQINKAIIACIIIQTIKFKDMVSTPEVDRASLFPVEMGSVLFIIQSKALKVHISFT